MTATVAGLAARRRRRASRAVERRAGIPVGFRAGGLAAGIKASGRPDLAVVVTTAGPAAAAAVFTPNAFAAAPVRLSRAHLAATSGDPRGGFGWAAAVISTSGCANAATGAAGDADQAGSPAAGRRALGVERDPGPPPLDRDHRDAAAARPGRGRAGRRSCRRCATTTPAWRRRRSPSGRPIRVTKLATTTVELPDADGRPCDRHRQRASPRASG